MNITEGALIQRINRKLAHEGQKLCKTRPDDKFSSDLGEFYIMDMQTSRLETPNVDPEELGRELGVLGDNETVIGDSHD